MRFTLLSRRSSLSVALLLATLPCNGLGQSLITRRSCNECSVTSVVERVVGAADASIPDFPSSAALDAQGRLWLTFPSSLPAVYGLDGRFISFVGRYGEGPGEFLGTSAVRRIRGDSMLIVDPRQNRAVSFSADFRPGRTVQLPGTFSFAAVIDWPRVIFNGTIPNQTGTSASLHLLDLSTNVADVRASFGESVPPPGQSGPGRSRQLLARAGNSLFTGEMVNYRIYRWDFQAALLDTLQRRPAWFSSESPWSLGSPTVPPPPFVTGIQADSEGMLWVFLRRAVEQWAKAWPPIPIGVRELRRSQGPAVEKLYETVIEVINPSDRSLVVQARTSGLVVDVLGGNRVAMYDTTPEGEPVVKVVQFALRRQRR